MNLSLLTLPDMNAVSRAAATATQNPYARVQSLGNDSLYEDLPAGISVRALAAWRAPLT